MWVIERIRAALSDRPFLLSRLRPFLRFALDEGDLIPTCIRRKRVFPDLSGKVIPGVVFLLAE